MYRSNKQDFRQLQIEGGLIFLTFFRHLIYILMGIYQRLDDERQPSFKLCLSLGKLFMGYEMRLVMASNDPPTCKEVVLVAILGTQPYSTYLPIRLQTASYDFRPFQIQRSLVIVQVYILFAAGRSSFTLSLQHQLIPGNILLEKESHVHVLRVAKNPVTLVRYYLHSCESVPKKIRLSLIVISHMFQACVCRLAQN